MSAAAQTGTVPLDAGTPPSGLTNSNITELNGNVGIGTTNPSETLSIGSGTNGSVLQMWTSTWGGFLSASGGSNSNILFLYPLTGDVRLGSLDGVHEPVFEMYRTSDYTQQVKVTTSGNSFFNGGNVGIGTTSPGATVPGTKLEVNGGITLTTNSGGAITFQDGTKQSTAYTGVTCTGADYAEAIDVTGDRTTYEPGDLLVLDPNAPGKFLKSNQSYSTLVAGIYSTKPGFVGRKQPATPESSATEVPMAMVGRVPTKVSAENGPIKVGDLLVTSSTPGYAMKGTDRSLLTGAVVGKAMGPLDSGTGTIEVLVTLQ